ncbi:MAG TPA: hypothetical protein VFJ57_03795 [Solirubrobacterales bacterium]|nr:hypothetical protein [Solirubrobacterales bacterium]
MRRGFVSSFEMRPGWICDGGEEKLADKPKREAASEELIRAEAMLVRALAAERKLLARCIVAFVVILIAGVVLGIGGPAPTCLLAITTLGAILGRAKGPPA